jgi:acetyl-CoA synthetase
VVRRSGAAVPFTPGRDFWYDEAIAAAAPWCPPVEVGAEHPLFILYTSGSTGKPKGLVHTTGGYLVHAGTSWRNIFDWHEGDVFWCTADVGRVTAHTYKIYGPLLNGATSVMFEGVPSWPDSSRWWSIIERYRANIFYTAPTTLRSMMREGEAPVHRHDLSSLRVLGSVGEPINPEAWRWYHQVIGGGRCPIVDTYWQTETGAVLLVPLPGAVANKPGLCHPERGDPRERHAAPRNRRLGARPHRSHRHAGRDPVGGGVAKKPGRQNPAPHSESGGGQ